MADAVWRLTESDYKKLQYGWENIGHYDGEQESYLGRVVIGTMCVEFTLREDGTDAIVLTTDYNTAGVKKECEIGNFNDGTAYYEVWNIDCIVDMLNISFGFGNPLDVFKKNIEEYMRKRFPEATALPSTAHLWNEEENNVNKLLTYEMTADVKCYICANDAEEARVKLLSILNTSGVHNISARRVPRKDGVTGNGHECHYMKLRDAAKKIVGDFAEGRAQSYSFADANDECEKYDVKDFLNHGSGFCVAFKIDPKNFNGYGVHIGVSSYGNGYMSVVSGNDDTISKLIDMMSAEMDTHGCACDADSMIYLEKEE